MRRRSFLALLFGLGLALVLPSLALVEPAIYGGRRSAAIAVDRKRARLATVNLDAGAVNDFRNQQVHVLMVP